MTERARKRQDAWRKTNKLNVTFNTHEATKALKSSGFDEKQAEAVVETIDKAVNETVATKADLAILGADLKIQAAKIDALRETVEGIQENMATKSDLAVLTKTVEGIQENIDKNIATKTEIANLETRMLRMMLLQTLVLVGTLGTLFVAVVKLL